MKKCSVSESNNFIPPACAISVSVKFNKFIGKRIEAKQHKEKNWKTNRNAQKFTKITQGSMSNNFTPPAGITPVYVTKTVCVLCLQVTVHSVQRKKNFTQFPPPFPTNPQTVIADRIAYRLAENNEDDIQ